MLLHVIDVSDKNFKEHIKVVLETLKDINVDRPCVYIFNKVDKSTEDFDKILEQNRELSTTYCNFCHI